LRQTFKNRVRDIKIGEIKIGDIEHFFNLLKVSTSFDSN